jgi:hypothetical protein
MEAGSCLRKRVNINPSPRIVHSLGLRSSGWAEADSWSNAGVGGSVAGALAGVVMIVKAGLLILNGI